MRTVQPSLGHARIMPFDLLPESILHLGHAEDFMANTTCLCPFLALFFCFSASATQSRGGSSCEYQLSSSGESWARFMFDHIVNGAKPDEPLHVMPQLKEDALKVFGLARFSKADLTRLALVPENFESYWISGEAFLKIEFRDTAGGDKQILFQFPAPEQGFLIWNELGVEDAKPTRRQLRSSTQNISPAAQFGFVVPSSDGEQRIFVALKLIAEKGRTETYSIRIGVDVDCAKLDQLVVDARHVQKVYTGQGTYCRIPILKTTRIFKRGGPGHVT